MLSNNDKGDLYRRVVELGAKGRQIVTSCTTDELTRFFAAFSGGDRTRAFLKVQDGCDYCCSYCTIHYARGAAATCRSPRRWPRRAASPRPVSARSSSRASIPAISAGQPASGSSIFCGRLDAVEGIERYRISSIEPPNLLTDEIIDFCASSTKFQHHFHIPLQSGSDRILGLMRRRYTTARFADRIAAVRRRMPDAFIGIDVIVGFPGETEADFPDDLRFSDGDRSGVPSIFSPSRSGPVRRPSTCPARCRRRWPLNG